MAKAPNSVIGVDLGRHAIKSVLMHRRASDRFAVSNYATRVLNSTPATADQLAREVKALLKDMGGSAKMCAVSVSSSDLLMRIIEQPETPPELLREALRLNGVSMLNQECREYVLDCDLIPSNEALPPSEPGMASRLRYIVGGLKRTQVRQVTDAFNSVGTPMGILQLAPISIFNAFEFARPEIFHNEAFFLIDMGHISSTMLVGTKRELVLVRTIDFGGNSLLDSLIAGSGESRDSVLLALEQDDEIMVENARVALSLISREIGSSIGFFEGRREETIGRIFISGGMAKCAPLLRILSEELRMPCEAWNALAQCEVTLSDSKKEQFTKDALDLNAACGAATELLTAE